MDVESTAPQLRYTRLLCVYGVTCFQPMNKTVRQSTAIGPTTCPHTLPVVLVVSVGLENNNSNEMQLELPIDERKEKLNKCAYQALVAAA